MFLHKANFIDEFINTTIYFFLKMPIIIECLFNRETVTKMIEVFESYNFYRYSRLDHLKDF